MPSLRAAFQAYWSALSVVVADHINREAIREQKGTIVGAGGVSSLLADEVDELLSGRSPSELRAAAPAVQSRAEAARAMAASRKIHGGNAGIASAGLWPALARAMEYYECQGVLRQLHRAMLRCRIKQLRRVEERIAAQDP